MAFEPRNLTETMALRLVARADQFYLAGDWASALPVYQHLIESQPAIAEAFALALAAGHCAIELADAAALEAWSTPAAPATGASREATFAHDIRVRAMHYCRAKDFLRASTLLRHIAAVDEPTRISYADGLLTRHSDGEAVQPAADAAPPRFITDYAIDALPIERIKARVQGMRMVVVRRYGGTKSRFGAADTITRTATAFGLVVHEFPSLVPPDQRDAYVGALRQLLDSFQPQLIFWDELFLSGVSADPGYRDAVAQLLEDVRRRAGIRVIKYYSDVWYVTHHTPDMLFAHLGRCYDLINHIHPGILDLGTDAEKAAVFCCHNPAAIDTPTAAPGTIPRACFVGSLHPGGTPRIVWWAECGRAKLDLDFIETIHDPTLQLSDVEYANLLRSHQMAVNFTLRPGGARIFTGRVLETALAGGLLLEEDSADTRYFLTPGVHYVPFQTLPDLAALIPALRADAPRRQRIAAAATAFVQRYYTGDVYWAAMLSKLFP